MEREGERVGKGEEEDGGGEGNDEESEKGEMEKEGLREDVKDSLAK